MKSSQYNIEICDTERGTVYWYNTLTNSHFRISAELNDRFKQLLDSPDDIQRLVPGLYEQFVRGGFYVGNDINELDLVRKKSLNARQAKNYFLIILPTLNCNFKCWYCIQDHVVSVMGDETMERIKRHIVHMIQDEGISSLHISWFGGEPFMFYRKVIKPLSLFAMSECDKAGIPFKNSATTNGYFIDEEVSGELSNLRFMDFQITLDGCQAYHDKVKFMDKCPSAFLRVLSNINRFLGDNPEIRLYLRINYTHETLTPDIVREVADMISSEYRHRVIITVRKVWQEDVKKSFAKILDNILDQFEKEGFLVERWNVNAAYTSCYVNKKYYNAINFNGNVVKCTACNDLYERDAKGILGEDGSIVWNDDFDTKCSQATFEVEECLKCKFLPVCMGPCPRNYLSGRTQCKYDYGDTSISHDILMSLRDAYLNEQNLQTV